MSHIRTLFNTDKKKLREAKESIKISEKRTSARFTILFANNPKETLLKLADIKKQISPLLVSIETLIKTLPHATFASDVDKQIKQLPDDKKLAQLTAMLSEFHKCHTREEFKYYLRELDTNVAKDTENKITELLNLIVKLHSTNETLAKIFLKYQTKKEILYISRDDSDTGEICKFEIFDEKAKTRIEKFTAVVAVLTEKNEADAQTSPRLAL